VLNLNDEFPIRTQTSDNDKIVLLKIREILNSLGTYSYVEIGSFLGGSLTPFIKDVNCTRILSIDDRGRALPDERGISFDYAGVTHESMIHNLQSVGLSTEKLQTFDGSVDKLPSAYLSEKYDFIFIDGEHTDFACFRDFVHSKKLLKYDSVVAFHDSTLISIALRLIIEMLKAKSISFTFLKVRNSEMSIIAFNELSKIELWKNISAEEDLELFYKSSEDQMLLSKAANRIALSFSMAIKDAPTVKAF
jgi:hypothetical protein